ncbi:MAG: hypothetical protein MJ252_25085 [archaeon]|nr:hypothetical protein [archaeon]
MEGLKDKDSKVFSDKWKDLDDDNIKINLNSKNRLKKLKKDLSETEISAEEYQKRLREQYQLMNDTKNNIYKWAEEEPEDNKTKGELDLLLQTNNSIVNSNQIISSSNILKYKRLNAITKNNSQHSSITTTINFHPLKENIVITTGLDKNLKIFEINQKEDKTELIKIINSKDIPITSANFINNNLIIFTGRRKHYYTYDMESQNLIRYDAGINSSSNDLSHFGNCFVGDRNYGFGDENGNIYIYDNNSMRFNSDIKIQGGVTSICFNSNGINLFASNTLGEIYLFDLRKYRDCINKINDYGNSYTNCMCLSNNNKYLATGSKSGYVNVYNADDLFENKKETEPIKVFDNLTTSCDYIRFNSDSSVLGMSSRWKKNAMRFIKLNTMKVYSNFPNANDRIKYPICFDFNSNNSLLGIGNDEGKALLYKIDL